MNTINENEVRLANLEAVADMRRAEMLEAYKPLSKAVEKILNDAIAASGANGYRVVTEEDGLIRDIEWMEIDGKDANGERLHGINLRFRGDDWFSKEMKERKFSFNTCAFGDVKVGDTKGVAYCILVGYLAAHIQEIEDALKAIPNWEAYNNACRVYSISRREAEKFAADMKAEAESARLAEIEKRLVVGAVVVKEKVRRYDFEKRQSVYTGISTLEVEKVTAKLVFFKDSYRQHKKADVLKFLATGLDKGGWSFASDVDTAKFPCPVEA